MSKEAMKLALEALCDIIPANANIEEVRDKQSKASAALREALADQPAQQPLTDEEMAKAWAVADGEHNASASVKRRITQAIEAAHGIKEKNT